MREESNIKVNPSREEALSRGWAAFDELRRIASENGLTGMTLEEINEEIRLARNQA